MNRWSQIMTMPASMKTSSYVYGVIPVDGFVAWKLFQAAADGAEGEAASILDSHPETVNAQFWYQMPIHFAVRAGHAGCVKLLLERGAEPGESRFQYYSWDKLLRDAKVRGFQDVHDVLVAVLRQRFGYAPEFQELRHAIVERDEAAIETAVREKPELVTCADALGNTVLHWCVMARHRDWLATMVKAGANVDARRADGQTALQLAASEANDYWYRAARSATHPSLRNTWVMVGDLLAAGAEYTLSVAAAVGDQHQVARRIASDPVEAIALNSARISPLSYAAREGYTHIVEMLLNHGALPGQSEDLAPHDRALFEAAAGNHLDAARLLLEEGAEPNAGVDSCGTCLTVCRHHHGRLAAPMEQLLREYGATDPPFSLKPKQIRRALRDSNSTLLADEELVQNVMASGDDELLNRLLDHNPSLLNHLHAYAGIACPAKRRMLKVLIDRGLDVNQTDWLGKTLLHAAAARHDKAAVKLLLKSGADINVRETEFQETPLTSAVRACAMMSAEELEQALPNVERTVAYLVKKGAAVTLEDDLSGSTPRAWAARLKLESLDKLLV